MPVIILVVVLGGAFLFYFLFWPVPVRAVKWTPPKTPPLEGAFGLNQELAAAERLPVGGHGPEDVIVDRQGWLVTGLADGRLVRLRPDGSGLETLAHTGGRPLGLAIDTAGTIVVADAYKGLLRVTPAGEVTILTDNLAGRPFVFPNHLDVAADGTIYFSETSDRFTLADYKGEFLESRPNGHLLAYDPKTGETRLVLDDLYYANGVAISPDQSYLLVCEGSRYRVQRLWLAGPRAGETEIFIDNLPGFPDNLHSNGRGIYWLALVSPRKAIVDGLAGWPFLRKIIYRLPEVVKPGPDRHGLVFGLNEEGRVVYNLQDPSGAFFETSGALEHDGWLYVGSLSNDAIGRLPLSNP